jgi:hypothetical protein
MLLSAPPYASCFCIHLKSLWQTQGSREIPSEWQRRVEPHPSHSSERGIFYYQTALVPPDPLFFFLSLSNPHIGTAYHLQHLTTSAKAAYTHMHDRFTGCITQPHLSMTSSCSWFVPRVLSAWTLCLRSPPSNDVT